MKYSLVIRLPQAQIDHNTLVEWLLFDEQLQKTDGTVTVLSDIADAVAEHIEQYDVYVIAPAEDVLLTRVSIPSNQLKQVKQALPFMVEESLACDIETVHLALAENLDLNGGHIDVAVVAHSVLIHWLDMLHSNNLSPRAITVDVLCVPRDELSWSLVVDKQRLLIRTADDAGAACEITDIEMILSAMLRQCSSDIDQSGDIKPSIKLIDTRHAERASSLMVKVADYIHNNFPEFEVKQTQYQEESSELLACHYLREFDSTLNLLQGGYRVRSNTDTGFKRWSLVASIAAIGVASYLLVSLASGFYFSQQAKQLDSEAIALYKQLFPNEQRIVSPKKQMQNHLRLMGTSGGTEGFMPLVAQTAKQFAGASANEQLAVQQLRFDSDRNDLQLEVQGQSIEQLDQFKQLLADSGLSVDISSATEQDNRVVGRLIVRKM